MRVSALCFAAAAASASAQNLQPLQYKPLKMGAVVPQGWLQRELQIQGAGLAGHFDEFYEPMQNSQWLGGTSTFEDWVEIFPYIIDGYVTQAILLNDTTQLTKVEGWMDYVLNHRESNGWLGPEGQNDNGMMYWPRWPILLTFYQWYEYTGNYTYIQASLDWLQEAAVRMQTQPMGYDWSGVRTQDWIYVLEYLLEDDSPVPAAEKAFLWNFTGIVLNNGRKVFDWERTWFVDPSNGGWFPTEAVPGNQCNLTNHGVNTGMAVKSGATMFRYTGDQLGVQSSYTRMQLLDKYHGVPTGVFQADEHYAGVMPSHGTETCTVVELMWSYNIIHETIGDALFADRAEKIAYNALPGSMTKDLWTRVYLQQMNEPISVSQDNHVWISDGPDSIIYSLQGNYACCTSNFIQGWPKYIQRMVHSSPTDGGVVISLLGPVLATLPSGATVNVTGEYPFEDILTITVSNPSGASAPTPLYIRVPAWATQATVTVNGGAPISVGSKNGTVMSVPLTGVSASGSYTVVFDTNPAIIVDNWFSNSIAVHRGALVYSLQLGETFQVINSYYLGSKDYYITQPNTTNYTTAWNSALVIDPSNPSAYLTFERVAPVPEVPYSSTEYSNIIKAKAVQVKAWTYASDGSAAPPPESPVDCSAPGACGAAVDVILVPYGTTHLRMTEMPFTMPSAAAQ